MEVQGSPMVAMDEPVAGGPNGAGNRALDIDEWISSE